MREKAYVVFYGLICQRLCDINEIYAEILENSFKANFNLLND